MPGSWPNARRGDVIAVGDELFVALRDIQDLGLISSVGCKLPVACNEFCLKLKSTQSEKSLFSCQDNLDGLKPLERGSFLRPKSPTVDDVEKAGEIFFDETKSEYYRSVCAGSGVYTVFYSE